MLGNKNFKDKFAIVGLGVTDIGKIPGISADGFKTKAITLAIDDAGLTKNDIDACIIQTDLGVGQGGDVPRRAGINSTTAWTLESGGSSANAAVAAACGILEAGIANYVVCVCGANTISRQYLVGGNAATISTPGAIGLFAASPLGAFPGRVYLEKYNRTREDFYWVAQRWREYAIKRPDAQMRRPFDMDVYMNSRWIVEPMCLFDCCLTSDGGAAVIVTTAERAKNLKKPPVWIKGIGFGHGLQKWREDKMWEELPVEPAKEAAFNSAGITVKDVDTAQFYDAFTPLPLLQMEQYGFCGAGEAGEYLKAGKATQEGETPMNTSGTELSWGYLQGYSHMVESVRQVRGEARETQVKDVEIGMSTGLGGTGTQPTGSLAHSCLILGKNSG